MVSYTSHIGFIFILLPTPIHFQCPNFISSFFKQSLPCFLEIACSFLYCMTGLLIQESLFNFFSPHLLFVFFFCWFFLLLPSPSHNLLHKCLGWYFFDYLLFLCFIQSVLLVYRKDWPLVLRSSGLFMFRYKRYGTAVFPWEYVTCCSLSCFYWIINYRKKKVYHNLLFPMYNGLEFIFISPPQHCLPLDFFLLWWKIGPKCISYGQKVPQSPAYSTRIKYMNLTIWHESLSIPLLKKKKSVF